MTTPNEAIDDLQSSPRISAASLRASLRYLNPQFLVPVGAVGDGVENDSAAVQSAIDEAATKGIGRVVFPKGIYAIKGVHLKSGLTYSFDRGACLIAHSSSTIDGAMLDANDESDIWIEGGIFDGNLGVVGGDPSNGNTLLQLLGASNVRVSGSIFRNNDYASIIAAEGSNIRVEESEFYDTDCALLIAKECDDVWAVGNRIVGGSSDGIAVWGTGSSGQSTNVHITGNTIRGKTGFGVIVRRCTGFDVSGNFIEDCDHAVNTSSGEAANGAYAEHGIIARNVIGGIRNGYAIGGGLARHLTVSENIIRDGEECGIWGIDWSDFTVNANTVLNVNGDAITESAGIRLTGACSGGAVYDNRVVDNRVTSLHHKGIQIGAGCDDIRVHRNRVLGAAFDIVIETGATDIDTTGAQP